MGGGAWACTVSFTCRAVPRQRELAAGFVRSGGLGDWRNGGGDWNLGTDLGGAARALGGAGVSPSPAGHSVSLPRGS